MNERLLQYWGRITQYWKKVNRKQKIIFFSALFCLILAIGLLTYHFSKTEYSLAFTDLGANDAASIKNYLETQGIDYKLSADGKSIGVPSTKVSEVKIDVESQGLMKNGSLGYGIFKENLSSFGMTDNEFNILKVDAQAGEIQQLINHMNGVSSSKVLIDVPEESVFLSTNDQDKASAAVVVDFKPGYPPNQKLIDTIYNLVAHSVPNLPTENITISDQNGELLPSSKMNGGLDSSASLVAEQFQIKKQFETDVQRNVQNMLGTILGRSKVIVSVFSTLNFDKKNIQEQRYEIPTGKEEDKKGLERSVQEIQKSYTGKNGSAGGVPGTGETDVPNYPGSSDNGETNSEELQKTINYEVDEIKKQIVSSPYVVKDLTINVGIEPPISNRPNSLTKETKDAVQRILMNVVKASLADSGQDNLTDQDIEKKVMVLAHSFEGRPSEETSGMFSGALWYGLGGVALAVIAGGGYLLLRRRKQETAEEEVIETPTKVEFPTIDIENVTNDSQARKQLETLAKKKPEEFVNLLRTWLVDE